MTKMKCLTMFLALGFFAGVALGDNPKTYRINLRTASKVGSDVLQPGEYKLGVHAHSPNVVFTETNTGQEFRVDAKVETAPEKFNQTAVHSQAADGGAARITEIRFGGTKTRIVFQ
jgi:hypothetical protein